MVDRKSVVKIAQSYVGCKQGGSKHHKLVDTFNSVSPHGERGNYTCPWCAISWTAWMIMGGVDQSSAPYSYNTGVLIDEARKIGAWVEDDAYVPQPGDGIIYNWSDSGSGDCNSGSSHVGLVEGVDGDEITVIEGNKGTTHMCGRRVIKVNSRYIRGYITPKYEKKKYSGSLPNLTVTERKTKKLGHALSNEHGRTHGGKKGDQTGSEVAITKWMYSTKPSSHLNWQYVARAKDKKKRLIIADAMRKACHNKHIGYNIDNRLTLMAEAKKVDFQLDKVKKNCDCDCSALVRVCCYAAGIRPENFKTGGELKALKKTGAFKIYKYKSGMSLEEGDILWKPNAHTAVLVQGGSTKKTRALKRGDTRKTEVKKWQAFLNWYFGKKVVATDGVFGDYTLKYQKKYQAAEGLTTTGNVGSGSLSHAKKAVR